MDNYEKLLSKFEEIILILKKGQFANQTPKKTIKRVNRKKGEKDMQRGSITYRSDGRWMGRCYDENGKQKCVYAHSKKECSEKLKDLIDEVEKNKKSSIVTTSMSLQDYFELWFKLYKTPTIKESTILQIKRLMTRHISSIWNFKIRNISVQMLQGVINAINSETERKITYSNLNQMYEKLFFMGVIQQNLMGMVVLAKTDKNRIKELQIDDKKQILEIGEENKIIYSPKQIKYKYFIEFAINTGMRPGEILGLQKRDLNFEKKYISISKQLNATTCKISSPKSKKGNRIIPMFDKTEELLKDMNVQSLKDEDFVFDLKYNTIQRFFENIKNTQGIIITCKMFRKTFSSRCQHLYGIDQKQVQAWLGHESAETTDRHYTFISNEESLANIKKYNSFVDTQADTF